MALKGIGISDDIFVDQTYHTPEDYTLPTPSQGDYATPQTYFQADYVNNALDLVSTFTIQAEGTVFSTRATPASEFTLTVSCERNRDLGAQSLSSSFTVTAEGSDFDFAILPQITAFSPRFLRAVVTTIGHMPDATWNTYAESEYIDRTWDEFSDYQWDYLDDVFIRSTFTKALGGYLAKATATLTAFNNASITMTRFREFSATPPTVSTMSVNANYTTGTPQTITGGGGAGGGAQEVQGCQHQWHTIRNDRGVNDRGQRQLLQQVHSGWIHQQGHGFSQRQRVIRGRLITRVGLGTVRRRQLQRGVGNHSTGGTIQPTVGGQADHTARSMEHHTGQAGDQDHRGAR